MPNWVHNGLTVTGKDVSKFSKAAKTKRSSLSFNNFIPMPKELENTEALSGGAKNKKLIKKYGADNWYDWHCESWGTKWDARAVELITNKKNKLVYRFDTAWAPPIPWLQVVSKKFPSLEFVLDCTEEMGAFVGTATAKNGKVTEDFDRMNNGKFYEVIELDGENPIIVKFLDKGLSLTLYRKNVVKDQVGSLKKESDETRQHLFKVEHNGKVKMLELPVDFIYLMNNIRVKGKTYMVIRKIIENEKFVGMRELSGLNTLENFRSIYDCSISTIPTVPREPDIYDDIPF